MKDPRKNYMRNKPCPCGSKKKFKNCCWKKYTPKVLEKTAEEMADKIIEKEKI